MDLASWSCAHCGTAAQPKKKNLITEYPKLLWIQLKRFETEFEAGSLIEARQRYLRHYVRCEDFFGFNMFNIARSQEYIIVVRP